MRNSTFAYKLILLISITFLVLLGLFISIHDPIYFEKFYVREDGPIEWLTFVAHLGSTFLCLNRLFRFGSDGFTLFNLSLLFVGTIFLFGAGEEISWGQRIFNIQSPEFFQKYNSQGEISIHNLVIQDIKINKVFFGTLKGIVVGIYFLILPILYSKVESVRICIDKFAIPVPSLDLIFFYALLALTIQFCASPKKGELLEFLGGWVFVILIWLPKNKSIFIRNRTDAFVHLYISIPEEQRP